MPNNRLTNLRRRLKKEGLDGLLVSTHENISYLSGFIGLSPEERECWLCVTGKNAHLITDSRYAEQAKSLNKTLKIHILKSGETFFDLFPKIARKSSAKRIGFEGKDLKFAEYERLKKELKPVKLIPTEDLVEELRKVKDDVELEHKKRAIEITDNAFDRILGFIKPGLTEKEVGLELERSMRQKGAEDIAFKPIVASGPGSAEPHYFTSDKELEEGKILLMDFGAKFAGYCADMTRCVVLGKPTKKQEKVYQTVLKAQEKAIKGIRPGMTGAQADAIARGYIKKQGFPPYAHGLGHGVGLAIHEAPFLRPKRDKVLKEAMVFSIEPGIYLPGWGGVRIEDLVVLKEDGVEVLTKSPKQLLVV